MVVSRMVYASFAGSTAVAGVVSSSILSSLMDGSSDDAFEVFNESISSTSSFLLLPFGAGSSGVRQYVTVLVTTCRTLTLPGLPLISGSISRGENVALHGAALSGVDE